MILTNLFTFIALFKHFYNNLIYPFFMKGKSFLVNIFYQNAGFLGVFVLKFIYLVLLDAIKL